MTALEVRLRLSVLQRELYEIATSAPLAPDERKVVTYAANVLRLLRAGVRPATDDEAAVTADGEGSLIHVSFTRQ